MIVAANPRQHVGATLDTGHCMRHVQIVAGVPHSSQLRRGAKVRAAGRLPVGTVIATFDANGNYANATDGSSHIAILLDQRSDGLLVVDAWVGKPVGERLIRWRAGYGKACDDADAYFVVETANDE